MFIVCVAVAELLLVDLSLKLALSAAPQPPRRPELAALKQARELD
jgi:hypothetical protein